MLLAAIVALALGWSSGAVPLRDGPADAVVTTVEVSALDGSTTPTNFVLSVDVAGATSAKLVIDGVYVGRDDRAPLQFPVDVAGGSHRVRVRVTGTWDESRIDATFTAAASAGAVTTSTTTAPTTTTTTTTTTGGGRPPSDATATIAVDTVEEIRSALATARPGAVIQIADGEYTFKPRLVASASGTVVRPITLRGSRAVVLRTKNASGDYGLHVTGDHWWIEGLTVAHASKGIVLDGSVGTVIDGVEVYDVGDEGIHFRMCSSDGVLRNSFIHDTGRNSAQYGEGVYVGSANSNWSKYECTDDVEGQDEGDNTERVLIEDNVFEDITAEGADLKEGTDSGTLRRNVFRRTGTSGQNSADSAVDAKGNNWVIEDNTVSETDARWDDDGVLRPSEFEDGWQAHSVYDGYGTGNVFRGNTVEGSIPGFGIGLYPGDGNIVTCDNSADDAAEGLVGENSHPVPCGPTAR
jgi:Right handed beta helix region